MLSLQGKPCCRDAGTAQEPHAQTGVLDTTGASLKLKTIRMTLN